MGATKEVLLDIYQNVQMEKNISRSFTEELCKLVFTTNEIVGHSVLGTLRSHCKNKAAPRKPPLNKFKLYFVHEKVKEAGIEVTKSELNQYVADFIRKTDRMVMGTKTVEGTSSTISKDVGKE